MLNEEYGLGDLFSSGGGAPGTKSATKYSTCEMVLMNLYKIEDLGAAKKKALQDIVASGKSQQEAQKILDRDLTVPTYVTAPDYSERKKYCLKELNAILKKPSPEPSPQPSEPPKPEYKAEQGKCGPSFVGLNGGITKGPKVNEVQEVLAKLGILKSGYVGGTVDTPTNNAIFELQKRLAPLGNKIASGLGGTYEGTAIKPDGCYGPKTSCAVSLMYKLPDVYNNNVNKCMRILKISTKQFKKASGEAALPASQGIVDLKESKDWITKTREGTSSSLFERLVQDVSKKKVL